MIVKLIVASLLVAAVVQAPTSTAKTTPSPSTANKTTVTTNPTTKKNVTTNPPTNTTVTTKPTTNTTVTTKPTTNTTVTTKPTTNTTVTTKPTTKTTGTTNPTTKTTSAPATTTPVPSSHPDVTLAVKRPDNSTCILIKGQFLMHITYNQTGGKTNTTSVGILSDSVVTGNCNSSNQRIQITVKHVPVTVYIVFAQSGNDITWGQFNVNVTYDESFFPNASGDFYYYQSAPSAFKCNKDGSYVCNSDTKNTFGQIGVETWNFQYTAFQKDVKSFSTDRVAQCSADAKTNRIVPIAVGAALAGLVVIVLIAYLIGRRRNRKGYESV